MKVLDECASNTTICLCDEQNPSTCIFLVWTVVQQWKCYEILSLHSLGSFQFLCCAKMAQSRPFMDSPICTSFSTGPSCC